MKKRIYVSPVIGVVKIMGDVVLQEATVGFSGGSDNSPVAPIVEGDPNASGGNFDPLASKRNNLWDDYTDE